MTVGDDHGRVREVHEGAVQRVGRVAAGPDVGGGEVADEALAAPTTDGGGWVGHEGCVRHTPSMRL